MRYNQEGPTQPIVDITQQSTLLSVFPSPSIATGSGYTSDSSAFYQQSTSSYPTFDTRQRLPSQSSVATHPLSSFRGPVTLHPPQQMSLKEQYSSSTPKFGRQAEMRHASPQAYHNVVMQPTSWSTHAPVPMTSSYHTTQESGEDSHSPPYSSRAPEDIVLPMENTEMLGTLQYLDNNGNPSGTPVEPAISATIHKNFFMGEKFYTCYRRNYMACNCSFSLAPYFPGVQLHYTPSGSSTPIPVSGFAMCISAMVSSSQYQEVTILQHTPKRDKGPISEPQKHHVGPKTRPNGGSPPHLGGYTDSGQSHSRPMYADLYGMNGCQSLPTEHNFDRIQFKTATANNGERRAGQQCYKLVVELWADLGEQVAEPWVRVAIQKSTDIVVRGRSPGHYQKEKRNSKQGSGGGPSPHSGNYPPGGNTGMGEYSNGGMLSGQPNGYGAPGPYEPRGGGGGGGGGMYGGGLRPSELGRRDMVAYPLENKPFDRSRMFPSSYTTTSVYGDSGLFHQNAQTAGVSPHDVYGKPRSDPDMGVLPRPSEPPLRTQGQLDGRCSNPPTSLYPLPSLVSGNFVSSSS